MTTPDDQPTTPEPADGAAREPAAVPEPAAAAVPAAAPAVPAAEPTSAERTAAAIGPWATAEEAFALLTVDVPAEHWIEALTTARDTLGLSFFDWLSAVDELADGFSVAVHLAAVGVPPVPAAAGVEAEAEAASAAGPAAAARAGGAAAAASRPRVRRVLLRTRIPRNAAALPTATGVFAGAGWHERETHEMFGIDFTGHPHMETLLLPDGFEGHPLRKEFVLAARVAKAWPGAKEPGESDHGTGEAAPAARRRMLPPGVPDPNEWGPLAGTLPPVAERPTRGAARGPRAAAAVAPAPGERPAVRADRPRRNRSVDQGSASQAAPGLPAADSPSDPKPATSTPTSPDAPWQVPAPQQGPPSTTQPDTTEPDLTEPSTTEPDRTPPGTTTPDATPPEATPPSTTGDDA